jgi:hypothetical protein
VTDSAHYIVSGLGAFLYRKHFYPIGVIVRTKDKVAVGYFYVFDGAVSLFANGIHILFAFSVGS